MQLPSVPDTSSCWTMYFDGSKRNEGAGAGVILISPKGDKLRYVLLMDFEKSSSNEAEYEALIHVFDSRTHPSGRRGSHIWRPDTAVGRY